MNQEFTRNRPQRILKLLKEKYPKAKSYDLDGRGLHFVCEVEPTSDHPEFDKAIEVIIDSKPHKHLKMTQYYTIISGSLELHEEDKITILNSGDQYIIYPNTIHWAKSKNECWIEILSKPGWTAKDHIVVN